MEIDSGPGPEPVKARGQYALGIDGLVAKTMSLWSRKLLQYIVIVGITGVVLVVVQAMVLFASFGLLGFSLLDFIGTSPLDSVFSLFLSTEPLSWNALMIVFILSMISMVVYAIVAGAAINYALTDYENPGTGDISESFSLAISRASSLVGTQILQSLIIIGLAMVALLLVFIEPLVTLALILLVLYIAVRLAPATATVMAEDQTSVSALYRSWQITGGFFWHVFFGQILMAIVVIIVDLAIGIIAALILFAFIPNLDLVVIIATIVASLILSPINYIYLAVLYKDLEARGTSGGYTWWQE